MTEKQKGQYSPFHLAKRRLDTLLATLNNLFEPSNSAMTYGTLNKMAQKISWAFNNDRCLYVFGNGGSMADACHFAEELVGKYKGVRRALPALALSDASVLTCVANDFGYYQMFSRYIEAFGREGDVAFALSTSGNSLNVIKALAVGQSKGLTTMGFVGMRHECEAANHCDLHLSIPTDHADIAQEIHQHLIHTLIEQIEALG